MGISTEQNKKNSHQLGIIKRWVGLKLKIQRENYYAILKKIKNRKSITKEIELHYGEFIT